MRLGKFLDSTANISLRPREPPQPHAYTPPHWVMTKVVFTPQVTVVMVLLLNKPCTLVCDNCMNICINERRDIQVYYNSISTHMKAQKFKTRAREACGREMSKGEKGSAAHRPPCQDEALKELSRPAQAPPCCSFPTCTLFYPLLCTLNTSSHDMLKPGAWIMDSCTLSIHWFSTQPLRTAQWCKPHDMFMICLPSSPASSFGTHWIFMVGVSMRSFPHQYTWHQMFEMSL